MREFSVINSVSQFHALPGLDPPKHPLVSVINSDQACFRPELGQTKYIFQVYTVAQKSGVAGALGYGRNPYDFQTGTLVFTSPG
jgi:AraC family transcriptional activator of pobA